MQCKVYSVRDAGNRGRLAIMPRPRGGDWLADETASLRDQGFDVVVSLLTAEEENELELTDESEACRAAGLKFYNYPIPDRQTPVDPMTAAEFLRHLDHLRAGGNNIVIHCRAGIGRASLIAAGVLACNGSSIRDAFAALEEARGCPVPDTPEQRKWLEDLFAPAD